MDLGWERTSSTQLFLGGEWSRCSETHSQAIRDFCPLAPNRLLRAVWQRPWTHVVSCVFRRMHAFPTGTAGTLIVSNDQNSCPIVPVCVLPLSESFSAFVFEALILHAAEHRRREQLEWAACVLQGFPQSNASTQRVAGLQSAPPDEDRHGISTLSCSQRGTVPKPEPAA